jgi:hypothetical protein
MILDRVLADNQTLGDLGVGAARYQQIQHFHSGDRSVCSHKPNDRKASILFLNSREPRAAEIMSRLEAGALDAAMSRRGDAFWVLRHHGGEKSDVKSAEGDE